MIAGFTAGIAVIIWVGQWKDFFGLQPAAPSGLHFHDKILAVMRALPELHLATTLIALADAARADPGGSLARGVPGLRRVPAPLLAMLVATVRAGRCSSFPAWPPSAAPSAASRARCPHSPGRALSVAGPAALVGPAFAIALLGAIESLLTAVVADGMTGTRHDSNQELIGQGAANLLAPLFGGFAATGAIARTATSIRNGATSPLAGIVHAVFLLLGASLLLAPLGRAHAHWRRWPPSCSSSPGTWPTLPHVAAAAAHRAAGPTGCLLLITFLLTVFVDLVVAVNVGVVLAALLFMRRMAETVRVHAAAGRRRVASEDVVLPASVLVYRIEGPFFFGAAEKLERTLERVQLGSRDRRDPARAACLSWMRPAWPRWPRSCSDSSATRCA